MSNDPRSGGPIHGPTTAQRPTGEKKSIRAWHIAIGLPPTFLVGLGWTLIAMGPATFIAGAWIAAAGIVWLLLDWSFFSTGLSLTIRILGALVTIAIAAVLGWVVFRPAPLTISSILMSEKFADGVEIAGIKWKKEYSGFRTVLRNDSNFQYTNIEFMIRIDVLIAGIGFNTKFSQCDAEPTLGPIEISGASISFPDKSGNMTATPLNFPLSNMYKIVCDKLLPHDPMEIVIATRRDLVKGGFDAASAVAMRGSFEAFLRKRNFDENECLIQGCAPLVIP